MVQQINLLNIVQKRLELIVGTKFREQSRVSDAVKTQDLIRSKIGSWNGTKEIRRWRGRRAN